MDETPPKAPPLVILKPRIIREELSDMNQLELFTARMENAAVDILENVVHRKRWVYADREALSSFLKLLVTQELRKAKHKN